MGVATVTLFIAGSGAQLVGMLWWQTREFSVLCGHFGEARGFMKWDPCFFLGGGKGGGSNNMEWYTPENSHDKWEITIFSRRFIFKWLAFQCHASFPRCNVDGFPLCMVWVSIAMTSVNRMSLA